MYQKPRGTNDILPQEAPYWRYVARHADEVSALYGCRSIETPIFERADLFVRGVGEVTDIVEKEMYVFEDRDGEEMALRPEATAGICRAYLEHGMRSWPQPVRLYAFGPLFRYDKPQAGRYRQFHQFDVEVIGEQDAALDAEVIDLAWRFYERMGLRDLTIQVNNIGCPVCRPGYIAKLRAYYEQQLDQVCHDCRGRLPRNALRLLDCKTPGCQPVIAGAPHSADHLCGECAEHWAQLVVSLEALKLPTVVNPRLVRGLDYYTKTVFEVLPARGGAQSSICGGGRYDGLIEQLGGPPTPAIGFATGVERIILALKEQGVAVPSSPPPHAFVACVGEAARQRTVLLLSELRRRGISAASTHGERSLRAQLRAAGGMEARYALILGDEELRTGTIVVRDLARAEQRTVPIERVADELSN
ncbi:MAG: histidine--tRNA ligase [Chloroflexi bacterium]|nr:histidine--tRNA ligase [Chloroflexota bacterium]